MEKFTSREWFEIGAGWVASIPAISHFDPLPLIGQQVEIDGRPYTVRGVSWNLVRSVGRPFGLVVDRHQSPNETEFSLGDGLGLSEPEHGCMVDERRTGGDRDG